MYTFLEGQRKAGKLTDAQVDYAITKNWITADQAVTLKAIPLPA